MTPQELKELGSLNAVYSRLSGVPSVKPVWKHRASSTSSFMANPLHYAIVQGLGVHYGANDKTIIGHAVHAGVDFGYCNQGCRLGLCIRAMVQAINDEFKLLSEEFVGKVSKKELYQEAVRVFKPYFKEVMPTMKVLESERYLEIDVPEGMYKNPSNFGKIRLTGTFDRLYEINGELVIGDLKTSSKTISSAIEKSDILQECEARIHEARKEILSFEKILSKFSHAEENLSEYQAQLEDVTTALEDAIANKKATKSLENKREKLLGEIDKWHEHQQSVVQAELKRMELVQKLATLEEQCKPFKEEYETAKFNADLDECKKAHSFQVALYSLMYMIVTGKEVKKVRLENIVKNKTVKIQVFEWELDEVTMERAEEAIQFVVSTIEAFYDGVEPKLLFRPNPYSYFGDETNKVISSFWNHVKMQDALTTLAA